MSPKKRWLKERSEEERLSLWDSFKYGVSVIRTVAPNHAIVMGISSVISALLGTLAIIFMGLIVSEINSSINNETAVESTLTKWIFWVSVIVLTSTVLGSVRKYSRLRLNDSLMLNMQRQVLQHASTLDPAAIENPRNQEILERANKGPGQTILSLLDGTIKTVSGGLQFLSLGAVMVWIEPVWTLVLAASVVPMIAISFWLSKIRHQHKILKTSQRRWSRYYSRILTHSDWNLAVTMLGLKELMLGRHTQQMEEIIEDNQKIAKAEIISNLFVSLVMTAALMGAIWFAVGRTLSGTLKIGEFAAFWTAAFRFFRAAREIGSSLSTLLKSRYDLHDLQMFFKLRPLVTHLGTEQKLLKGQIEIKDVSFRFAPHLPLVLENVTVSIEPGEIVALVGHNGAGKSTLAKLIAGLYSPTQGDILFDGDSIRGLSLEHLQSQISFVHQRVPQFESTVEEFIAFGDWERLKDDPDAVRQIAKETGIDDMINALPNKYQSRLGRFLGECDLSGGEWQKMVQAQTLAANSPIIILDEPAASLDLMAEKAMHDRIRKLLKGRTTIMISHRFSTVQMADRIIVLAEGQIAEQGTHAELLNHQGVYSTMVKIHQSFFDKTNSSNSTSQSTETIEREEKNRDIEAA